MRIITYLSLALLLFSCGNTVEEIKNPETGKLLKRYEYYTDDRGQKIKDGAYTEWDNSGRLISELNYVDDSLNGSCIYYSDNGGKYMNNYDKGLLNGTQSFYQKNGKLLVQDNYKMGVKHGIQKFFSNNGKLLLEYNYSNGIPAGKWKYYSLFMDEEFDVKLNNGVCKELIGKWIIEGKRESWFIFDKSGNFEYWYPNYEHFGKAEKQLFGKVDFGKTIKLIHRNGLTLEFALSYLKEDNLIFTDFENDEDIVMKKEI
jgi:antitoxin component YwqK of YwqJK toxin-antitoxin module